MQIISMAFLVIVVVYSLHMTKRYHKVLADGGVSKEIDRQIEPWVDNKEPYRLASIVGTSLVTAADYASMIWGFYEFAAKIGVKALSSKSGVSLIDDIANDSSKAVKAGDELGETVTKGVGSNTLNNFSATEQRILQDAKSILNSPEFAKLNQAYKEGNFVEININGYKVSFEPEFPPYIEGLTNFEGHGFHIGPAAFEAGEIEKTILHEVYRLNTSQASTGVNAGLAASETAAARNFADTFWELIIVNRR